ncbi:MAG: diadenylate cyclase CdaA [Bacteroidales bacterium]
MFDFVKIGLIDIIDILLVGFLIYQAYKLIKGTIAINIFTGLLLFYLIWLISKAVGMKLISGILGQVMGVGVLALIILFQQEIRRFLMKLGTRYMNSKFFSKFIAKLNLSGGTPLESEDLNQLTEACQKMSESRIGALIVLANNSSLEDILESGDRLDAKISARLIEAIFTKGGPMHDGAMILSQGRIVAARCTLPISENLKIAPHYGMRHRAALGVSEESDSFVVVISEESGNISFVSKGVIVGMGSINELRAHLDKIFNKK